MIFDQGPQTCVLVVDDESRMRETLSDILQEYGFDVYEAENGAQAVATVERESIDLVLLDLTMPVMDGATALREIRTLRPDAKVIIMTAYAHSTALDTAAQEGVEAIVLKPLDMEELVSMMRTALKAKE